MSSRGVYVPMFVSIILFIVLYIFLNRRFSLVNMERSSCDTDIYCSPQFDLTKSGIPLTQPLCHDMVSCRHVKVKSNTDSVDTSKLGINLDSVLRVPQIGCIEIPEYLRVKGVPEELCCRGNLLTCIFTQLMLSQSFSLHPGFSFSLGSSMCKYLPTCFIENDSSPYVLFPVPDFYIDPWKKSGSKLKDPIDVASSGLNKAIALAFGNLGAMPLSRSQAVIHVVTLPSYKDMKYFSFQTYLFQTGRYKDTFLQDLPFASLGDAFNITDLEKMAKDNKEVQDWINGEKELSVVVVLTHNKLIAEQVYRIKNSKFLEKLDELGKLPIDIDMLYKLLSDMPIICTVLPAGSTYGDTIDPLGRPMYKNDFYKTNKYISADTPLYDWKTDTIGLVARFTPTIDSMNEDTNEAFKQWKNDNMDQKNVFVLGIEMKDFTDSDYVPFVLADQNGKFDKQGKWRGGHSLGLVSTSSWKLQAKYTGELNQEELQTKMDTITQEMKAKGYGKVRDINISSHPSFFPHYNEYASKVMKEHPEQTTLEQDLQWSQSGVDITQYNVATFGDCRDTIYPTTDTFCLGPFDVIVLVSHNYMENKDILYNNINIYDTESQTSLGSFRGDHAKAVGKKVYSLAASRQDLQCDGNLAPSIDNIKFLPTGAHSNLYASTTTTFFCQSRCYVNIKDGPGYGTSPNMDKEQSKFLVRIFSPCGGSNDDKKYPSVCNNFEYEKGQNCSPNVDKSKACPNDLSVLSKTMAQQTDTITEAVCAPLRLDKTLSKNTLNLIKYVLISCLVVSVTILMMFYVSKRQHTISKHFDWKGLRKDMLPMVSPIFFIILAIVLINSKYNRIDDATAYDVKQSRIQR
jgi:hypothetical protein